MFSFVSFSAFYFFDVTPYPSEERFHEGVIMREENQLWQNQICVIFQDRLNLTD